MDGREEMVHAIEASRARLGALAGELARRSSVDWMKTRARSVAFEKSRALARPLVSRWTLGFGALALGAYLFIRFGGERGRLVGDTIRRVLKREAIRRTVSHGTKALLA